MGILFKIGVTVLTMSVSCILTEVNAEQRQMSNNLSITIANGEWGEGSLQQKKMVLSFIGQQLVQYFPTSYYSVQITHSNISPMTLYDRGPNGEFLVQLTAKNYYWAQFAHQFSHELCHIFADGPETNSSNKNQWFEESIAEVVSFPKKET